MISRHKHGQVSSNTVLGSVAKITENVYLNTDLMLTVIVMLHTPPSS